ncbi:MAG: GNAT family N-acetyltransferase, partial [Candidatus Heimdallarchaeota archaeon]|nr:GNAT family N-acetyltransferase [Candidatus Heimdallarchaeota archaeon]
SDRPSVKLRRILFRKDSREDETPLEENKHKFYVLKMTWDQAWSKVDEIQEIIDASDDLRKVTIRNLNPETDVEKFLRVYNRSFISAPDPYRSLTQDDFKHFDPESTFVAILYGQIVGFIFLTVEPLIKNSLEVGKQGVIAGLGVEPRYRRRKIAFLLAARAAEFFSDQSVDELICEVYYKNKVSYSFIQNFGMTKTGIIYL